MSQLFHLENGPEAGMTCRMIGEGLGVSKQTVWRTAKEVFPGRFQNGRKVLFNLDDTEVLIEAVKERIARSQETSLETFLGNGKFRTSQIYAVNSAQINDKKPETRGKKSQKQLMEEVADIAISAYKQGLKDGGGK